MFSYVQGCEGAECTKTLEVLTKTVDYGKPNQHADYLNQFNEMNSPTVDRKHRDAASVLPFIGLTGSKLGIDRVK